MTLLSRMMAQNFELPPARFAARVERDLRVPMGDGVILLADRYAPVGLADAPLVLTRSPYGRRHIWGMLFGRLLAERGFQAVVVSCRGTYGSGGLFDPFGDERADGLSTVDWMRRQPWYPGSFGTVGPSYLGFTQWAIAAESGPEHRAMAVQVTTSALRDMIYAGGSVSWRTMLAWMRDERLARRRRPLALLGMIGSGRRLERALRAVPISRADRIATGQPVSYFQQWLAHDRPGDPYWRDRVFDHTLARVEVPVSMVAGWHDFMLPWQLRDFVALRAAGRQPRLTIGPYLHADDRSIKGWMADLLPFLGQQLRGDPDPRQSPVRIFVTGAEQWRDLPDWPPAAPTQRWHLQTGGGLAVEAPTLTEPDRHRYDPADPTPALGGPADGVKVPRLDNAPLEARPDVLVYTSDPLADPIEVIGVPEVELFVSSQVAHLDVFARLCDVDPAGVSINVSDALLRLTGDNAPIDADGVRRVRFESWPVAHRFAAGHRLRLQVSGGAFPRYPRNNGTGGALADRDGQLIAAERAVHHGPDHPSALLLPIV